jgi:hypothetical protein
MKTMFQRQSCLVCFCLALGTFEYLQDCMAQKWAAAANSPIACLRSVDLEERIRWRMQTGSTFCCFSFGSSCLYALSCRQRSQPTLFLASFWGSSRPSHKVEGICNCALSQGSIILSKKSPLIDSHGKSAHDFNFVLSGKSLEEQVVAET